MSKQVNAGVIENRLSLVNKSIEALAAERKKLTDGIMRIEQDMIALAGEGRGLSALLELAQEDEQECAVIEEESIGN